MGSTTKLAIATSRRVGPSNALRVGIVASVSAAGVLVNLGGGTVPCSLVGGAGAGVAPGAVVSVFRQGSSWQVQGVINGPGQAVDTPNQPVPSTNSVILPGIGTGNPGSIKGSVSANLVTGLTSASGEIYIGNNGAGPITVILPKGHLCEVRCDGLVATTAGVTGTMVLVINIREGVLVAGSLYGEAVPQISATGFGIPSCVSGFTVGDGATHSFGLFAQALTASGSVAITRRPYDFFFRVIDWGDASGVTQQ